MITNKDVKYDPKTDTLTINGVRNQIAGAAEVETLSDAVDDLSDAVETQATAAGDLDDLETTDKTDLVGAINEVKAYQTRQYGTPVDITSASTSDLYTCPSDGFVAAEVNSSSDTSSLNVIDYDLNVVLISSGGTGGQHQLRNGCNVIKGQRLYNNIVNAAGAKVTYIPLVNS